MPKTSKDSRLSLMAHRRIFDRHAEPTRPVVGRGAGHRITLPLTTSDNTKVSLSERGRFLISGKLAEATNGKGPDGALTYQLGQYCNENGSLFKGLNISRDMRGRIAGELGKTVDYATTGPRSHHKERALSGAYCLLIDLLKQTPKSDKVVRRAIVDKLLQTFHRDKNKEQVGFYLHSMRKQFGSLDKTQTFALKEILKHILPKRPLVDEYTQGRTKPLEMRHMIHEEFWHEELSFFTKERGFKLVKKNSKDTRREYLATLKHPTGRKKDLKLNLVVEKGELDFLDAMEDPKAHVIMYSGHSALGGNGAQSIDAVNAVRGEHPKLVFIANCRGKDNYADFVNRFPNTHVIMTEHPTYGVSGQDRIEGLFDTLVRGNTYRYMRSVTEYEWWDEPADNYFYPDEWRKFAFMDCDEDGRVDFSKTSTDLLYNVERQDTGNKFIRALNFANSEIYYHWEVAHDNGKKSFFGREYGDSLIASGPIKNPKPDEIIRITPSKKQNKKQLSFRVKYNPELAAKVDENHLCALVTLESAVTLAKHKKGNLRPQDVVRGLLMGAQAIHYMDIYEDSNPVTMRNYFRDLGVSDNIKAQDIDDVFDAYDAHGSQEQITAFSQMLEDKYGVDITKWAKNRLLRYS